MTAGLLVEAKIVELLNSGASPASVDYNATIEYTADLMPAYNVALMKLVPDWNAATGEAVPIEAFVSVLCYAASDGSQSLTAAVDPLVLFAWESLVGDESLGGTAGVQDSQVEGVEYNYAGDSDTRIVEAVLQLKVKVWVTRGDVSSISQ